MSLKQAAELLAGASVSPVRRRRSPFKAPRIAYVGQAASMTLVVSAVAASGPHALQMLHCSLMTPASGHPVSAAHISRAKILRPTRAIVAYAPAVFIGFIGVVMLVLGFALWLAP